MRFQEPSACPKHFLPKFRPFYYSNRDSSVTCPTYFIISTEHSFQSLQVYNIITCFLYLYYRLWMRFWYGSRNLNVIIKRLYDFNYCKKQTHTLQHSNTHHAPAKSHCAWACMLKVQEGWNDRNYGKQAELAGTCLEWSILYITDNISNQSVNLDHNHCSCFFSESAASFICRFYTSQRSRCADTQDFDATLRRARDSGEGRHCQQWTLNWTRPAVYHRGFSATKETILCRSLSAMVKINLVTILHCLPPLVTGLHVRSEVLSGCVKWMMRLLSAQERRRSSEYGPAIARFTWNFLLIARH